MTVTIGSNIASLNTQRRLSEATSGLSRTFERLASGLRVNRASDDAAGLSIASALQTDVRLHSQGIRNANDGIAALSIAEGALQELSEIAIRIIELAEQSANGIYSSGQRLALDREAQALRKEFGRIANTTSFNGLPLLNQISTSLGVQVGITGSASSQIDAVIRGQTIGVGDGTFKAPSVLTPTASDGVLIADVNEDGVNDLFFYNGGVGSSVLLGNGDGTFKAEAMYYLPVQGLHRARLSDVNGDGKLDFVGPNGDRIVIGLGNGDGSFRDGVYYVIGAGVHAMDVNLVDVNGDGAVDLISDDGDGGDGLYISLGNGNGTFKTFSSFSNAGFQEAVGDLNGDGRVDIVMTEGYVHLGNGNGTFSVVQDISMFNLVRSPQLADLNGDGILDLAGGSSVTEVSVALGNGNGTFKAAYYYTSGDQTFNNNLLQIGDVNGDNVIDLIVSETDAGTIGVLINNGDGTFKAVQHYTPTASDHQSIAVGDLNGDGILDIVSGKYFGSSANIFLGNGTVTGGLAAFSLRSASDARSALTALKAKVVTISADIGAIGATQSRLMAAISNALSARINSAAAASHILDADTATEAARLAQLNIRQQAAAAVLA